MWQMKWAWSRFWKTVAIELLDNEVDVLDGLDDVQADQRM